MRVSRKASGDLFRLAARLLATQPAEPAPRGKRTSAGDRFRASDGTLSRDCVGDEGGVGALAGGTSGLPRLRSPAGARSRPAESLKQDRHAPSAPVVRLANL